MIDVIPFEALGRMDIGWLDAHYHFSFANYSLVTGTSVRLKIE